MLLTTNSQNGTNSRTRQQSSHRLHVATKILMVKAVPTIMRMIASLFRKMLTAALGSRLLPAVATTEFFKICIHECLFTYIIAEAPMSVWR